MLPRQAFLEPTQGVFALGHRDDSELICVLLLSRRVASSDIRVRYRPIRIGFCVRRGNWDDFDLALRCSYCLWGGRSNPIIIIDDFENAKQAISTFRVDCLCGATLGDEPEFNTFVDLFPHLAWPIFKRGIFSADGEPHFLDVFHPVSQISAEFLDRSEPFGGYLSNARLYNWHDNDPLRFILLATYGDYPKEGAIKRSYRALLKEILQPPEISVSLDEPIPAEEPGTILTPAEISRFRLLWDRSPIDHPFGLFIGRVDDFDDLVNYWNLRAAEIEVSFFDPRHSARLKLVREQYLKWMRVRLKMYKPEERFADNIVPVWTADAANLEPLKAEGFHMFLNNVEPDMWSGYDIKPPLMHFGDKAVLAAIASESALPSYSFQLPEKPFKSEEHFHSQDLVVSLRPPFLRETESGATFLVPFVPELNPYYQRQVTFPSVGVRAEIQGLGLITEADRSTLTIRGLRIQELLSELMSNFGVAAELSHAGRFATRLIAQMGGIQGCRVFKIRGVRELIEKYSPLKSFTKSAALQMIGDIDPATSRPRFTKYENLVIEYTEAAKLTPEAVFNYLAERSVFRVGLDLKCPACELVFWVPIDDMATEMQCE